MGFSSSIVLSLQLKKAETGPSLDTPSQEACASNPQHTMSVFPGTKSALLNGQTWFAKPGAAGLLFQLTLGRHLSLQKKKWKKKPNMP